MKKKIFSIALLGVLSTLNAGVISQNGVAKDSATGLMWQDEPYTQDEKTAYNKNTNNDKTGKWNYAKSYCENLTLDGFSDWRLPNIYEIVTLLDNTKSNKPFIIDEIKNINLNYYWSSTADASHSGYVWVMDFYNGYYYWNYKTDSGFIRCVRAGQLNFDNLIILKNQGKVKISQENIDKISPKEEIKRIKEVEIAKQKELEFQEKQQKKLELEQKDKSAYDVASSINTINSYKEYLKNYPNGNYTQSARSNMEYLSPEKVAQRKREQAEREKQAEYDRKHACSRLYVGKTALYLSSYDHGLFGSGNVTIKVQILGVGNGNASVKVVSSPGYGIRQIGDFFEEECSYFK